jgi:hypothetical protein
MPEISFYDPVCPVPEARQKEATKALNKSVDQADLERYPYIDITYASPATLDGVGADRNSLLVLVTAVYSLTAVTLIRRRRSASRVLQARARFNR